MDKKSPAIGGLCASPEAAPAGAALRANDTSRYRLVKIYVAGGPPLALKAEEVPRFGVESSNTLLGE